MTKKMYISVLLILLMLASTAMIIFAEAMPNAGKVDEPKLIEIINNLNGTKTFDKSYALCVRAKEGTVITFEQYWFKAGDDKSILLRKKQNEQNTENGEWILQNEREEWNIGASELYAKSITWKLGKNMIKLIAMDKEGNIETQIIEVELLDKNKLNDFIKSYILKNLDEGL